MLEFTLSDGRRCRLEARRDPAESESTPPVAVLQCEIDGQPPLVLSLHAGWAETAVLPSEVVDAIIRHFLLQ
ncbi:MAG: hypothetical protein ACXW61_18325 [Gemmatirosa sp.]